MRTPLANRCESIADTDTDIDLAKNSSTSHPSNVEYQHARPALEVDGQTIFDTQRANGAAS